MATDSDDAILDEETRRVFANNLRAARESNKLTQKELGALIGGIEQQTVGQWEKAQYMPRLANLVKLARVTGWSIDDLLGWKSAGKRETAAIQLVRRHLDEIEAWISVREDTDRQ